MDIDEAVDRLAPATIAKIANSTTCDGTVRISVCEALMVSPSLGVSVYYCKQTLRSASADAFRQMFVCLFKATVPSS